MLKSRLHIQGTGSITSWSDSYEDMKGNRHVSLSNGYSLNPTCGYVHRSECLPFLFRLSTFLGSQLFLILKPFAELPFSPKLLLHGFLLC